METQITVAVGKRLRLYLASQTLPIGQSIAANALKEWLEAMPTVGDFADDQDAKLQTSLTADLQRLTWRSSGETVGFFPKMQRFLAHRSIPNAARTLLAQIGEQLQPATVGMWIELMQKNLDIGCFFPGSLLLKQVLAYASVGETRETLQTWTNQTHCNHCTEFGLSLGAGNRILTFLIPLSGSTAIEQLNLGLEAFSTFKSPALPQQVTDLLIANAKLGLLLSVWLGHAGLIKIGLLIPQPDTELMLQLCSISGKNYDQALAKFEGSLGVQQPTYIECQQMATGFGVELHYDID
ncbi:hypothetical protein [Pantanalinema sp. GBBB05]|uniref:hypothetical protein n=1 Tax=Pantanalinema sp. GBBB05 TaxID=2604139 RepID=UPI001D4E2127|nr:hypothetical protein [Pantanalinema sp. GBBB05]